MIGMLTFVLDSPRRYQIIMLRPSLVKSNADSNVLRRISEALILQRFLQYLD